VSVVSPSPTKWGTDACGAPGGLLRRDARRAALPGERLEPDLLGPFAKEHAGLRIDVVVAATTPAIDVVRWHGGRPWPGARGAPADAAADASAGHASARKIHFAVPNGNIATATREVPDWPVIVNRRADPHEKAPHESGLYLR